MTSHEPLNIQRLVRQNDQYAKAGMYATSLLRGQQTSKWHERQTQRSGHPHAVVPVEDLLSPNATRNHHIPRELAEEVQAAYEAARLERKARLRSLLKQERLKYENELNAMGLATIKCFD
ncbi:hypothetical protein WJX72_002298 [[Myrmecia] bisecta]|uniref:Uncharacterized protein n=1 Tax=[Myrmecia] bisecta TaxID=41462 RepID=A0AAW1QPJ3_9CHLO